MLSLIIPAYNEELNIPRIEKELIPIIKDIKEKYEIIIIDDGSTDNTLKESLKLKSKNKNILVVKHRINKGLGCAVRTGIKYAKGDTVIILDSDFTFHPDQIPALLEAYKKTNADCVIGSHLLGEGGNTSEVIYHRLMLSRAVNLLYRILLGQKISSISSIFRLYRAKPLKRLMLSSTGFNINAEILFKLLSIKSKIIEIPARLTTRKFGASKLNTGKEIKNHLKLLAKIAYWKLTRK